MTRRIVILSLILGLFVLLSGCDAILEWFYPEFADANDSPINIMVTLFPEASAWTNNSDDPVIIELILSSDDSLVSSYQFTYTEPALHFIDADPGTYYVRVWWDFDPVDGLLGGLEPFYYSSDFEVSNESYEYITAELAM